MNNYEKLEEKYIEDIDSKATVYGHIKTKARIVTQILEQNAFTISFFQ